MGKSCSKACQPATCSHTNLLTFTVSVERIINILVGEDNESTRIYIK